MTGSAGELPLLQSSHLNQFYKLLIWVEGLNRSRGSGRYDLRESVH